MPAINKTTLSFLVWLFPLALLGAPPVFDADITARFPSPDARQGIAVDENDFFAINSLQITRHDKQTGMPLARWNRRASAGQSLVHMDSGMVRDDELVVAHSNYPGWPMTSSIEVWDAATLEHLRSHSFGELLGSLTWIDHDGENWWAGFANYDLVQPGMTVPYGETANTIIVKMDETFGILQRWTLPPEILEKMRPMSNSGGSWGPDGFLYLTGHDHPEIYVMTTPDNGTELAWVATVQVDNFNGQGIAWDRSTDGNILWAILRSETLVYKILMPELSAQ